MMDRSSEAPFIHGGFSSQISILIAIRAVCKIETGFLQHRKGGGWDLFFFLILVVLRDEFFSLLSWVGFCLRSFWMNWRFYQWGWPVCGKMPEVWLSGLLTSRVTLVSHNSLWRNNGQWFVVWVVSFGRVMRWYVGLNRWGERYLWMAKSS